MGPLAGVGDPIFWGTARIVLAALGASLAVTGNILGPLLFFFGMTAIRWGYSLVRLQVRLREGYPDCD